MTKFYVISHDDVDVNLQSISDEEFIKLSQQSYTPQELEQAFNNQELNTYTDQIRAIHTYNSLLPYKEIYSQYLQDHNLTNDTNRIYNKQAFQFLKDHNQL